MIESAMLMADGDLLTAEDLPASLSRNGRPHRCELPADGLDLAELERDLLEQAMQRSSGNLTRAAALPGLSRHQMRYRLGKLGRDH